VAKGKMYSSFSTNGNAVRLQRPPQATAGGTCLKYKPPVSASSARCYN